MYCTAVTAVVLMVTCLLEKKKIKVIAFLKELNIKIFFLLWGEEWRETPFPLMESLAVCVNQFRNTF